MDGSLLLDAEIKKNLCELKITSIEKKKKNIAKIKWQILENQEVLKEKVSIIEKESFYKVFLPFQLNSQKEVFLSFLSPKDAILLNFRVYP